MRDALCKESPSISGEEASASSETCNSDETLLSSLAPLGDDDDIEFPGVLEEFPFPSEVQKVFLKIFFSFPC